MSFGELLEYALPSAPAPIAAADVKWLRGLGQQYGELAEFLGLRNGFFAFSRALQVIGTKYDGGEQGLRHWNSPTNWKSGFTDKIFDGTELFFAQDAFADQFCIRKDGVFRFTPEDGKFSKISANFDGWCKAILATPDPMTGFSLLQEWEKAYGAISDTQRLKAKRPIALGGALAIENFVAREAAEILKSRAKFANFLFDKPEGFEFEIDVS